MAATQTTRRVPPISFRPSEQDRLTFERAHMSPSEAIRRGLRLLDAEMNATKGQNEAVFARARARIQRRSTPVPMETILATIEEGRR